MGAAGSSLTGRSKQKGRIRNVNDAATKAKARAQEYINPEFCSKLVLVNEESVKNNSDFRPAQLGPEEGMLVLMDDYPQTSQSNEARASMCSSIQTHYANRAQIMHKIASWVAFFDQRLDSILLGNFCYGKTSPSQMDLVAANQQGCMQQRLGWQPARPNPDSYDMQDPGTKKWLQEVDAFVEEVSDALHLAEKFAKWLEQNPDVAAEDFLLKIDKEIDACAVNLQKTFSNFLTKTAGLQPAVKQFSPLPR